MSNKKKQNNSRPSIRQRLVGVYLTLMFGVFPVFCTDGFFNIRHDRYYFFAALSLALLLFWGLSLLFGDRKNAIGKLSVTDWAMLCFLAVCIISTLFSIDPEKALWGTAGRNNGLFLMAIYVGVYFCISRDGHPGPVVFATLGIVSAFVSIVTILNFYSLDPLKMLEPLAVSDRKTFFSTIGNKNLLSGYLCITLPVLTVLSVESQCNWLRRLSRVCAAPGFAAMMTADSDSGLLGLGVFFTVYLIYYARHPEKLKRYMLALTVMLLCARILKPISVVLSLKPKLMGGLQLMLVSERLGLVLLLFTGALTVVLDLLNQYRPDFKTPKAAFVALLSVIGAALTAVTVAVIYFTLKPEIPLKGIMVHLRLDDSWGTYRGFIWRRTMDIFEDFSLWRKLIGSGPDTFYYMFQPYFEEMTMFWTSSTNAAHNEYLHYLITVGLLGTVAYCTALVSGLISCFRRIKQHPLATAFFAAVLCYAAQALVSIAQPITTPLFILFLAMCAGTRNTSARQTGKSVTGTSAK